MAETYKKIFPGNFVAGLNAWPLPNADFTKNKRAVGDPHDRQQQGVVYVPGFIAVQKVGIVHIQGATPAAPGTGAGVQGYDIVIPSVDSRPDDKPRADVKGLIVPAGASLYRIGLRVPRVQSQPGYFSSGAKDAVAPESSGLLANAGAKLWLEAKATDPTAAPGDSGAIAATGAHTGPMNVSARGDFDADDCSNSVPTPVITTAELSFRVWADKGGLGSLFLGGVYLVAEVCYIVEDTVPSSMQSPLQAPAIQASLVDRPSLALSSPALAGLFLWNAPCFLRILRSASGAIPVSSASSAVFTALPPAITTKLFLLFKA
jgi:hypothetical protein